MTRYAQRYPRRSSALTTYSIARPPSSWSMNGTFSRSTQGTARSASRSNTWLTSPDWRPLMPRVIPAWLRSWQGKPAATRSTSRLRRPRVRMSSWRGIPGKRASRTARAAGSISQSSAVEWPLRWSPSSMPPIPANNPATVSRRPRPARRGRDRRSNRSKRSCDAGAVLCRFIPGAKISGRSPARLPESLSGDKSQTRSCEEAAHSRRPRRGGADQLESTAQLESILDLAYRGCRQEGQSCPTCKTCSFDKGRIDP